jgi:hypothetical protein
MSPDSREGMNFVQRLILSNRYSMGDVVVFTAAVRELHRRYPGQFITDVRTSFPALWQNNPNITPLDENAEVRVLNLACGLIHNCNKQPVHYLRAYLRDLSEKLRLDLDLTEFHGDVHLSNDEKRPTSVNNRH